MEHTKHLEIQTFAMSSLAIHSLILCSVFLDKVLSLQYQDANHLKNFSTL